MDCHVILQQISTHLLDYNINVHYVCQIYRLSIAGFDRELRKIWINHVILCQISTHFLDYNNIVHYVCQIYCNLMPEISLKICCSVYRNQ
jgi:hypothetical protein